MKFQRQCLGDFGVTDAMGDEMPEPCRELRRPIDVHFRLLRRTRRRIDHRLSGADSPAISSAARMMR